MLLEPNRDCGFWGRGTIWLDAYIGAWLKNYAFLGPYYGILLFPLFHDMQSGRDGFHHFFVVENQYSSSLPVKIIFFNAQSEKGSAILKIILVLII